MKDPRIEKLAAVLVHYSLKLRPGDWVMLEGPELAAPLLKAVYAEALRAGAHPGVRVHVDGLDELFLRNASDEQLRYISETLRLETEKLNARLSVMGSTNTKALTSVDPKRMASRQTAMREITSRFLQRMGSGELRWCGTLFPNSASAQDADMSLSEYEEFVFGAGLLDREDPVSEWRRISEEQQRMVTYLNQRETIRVVGPDTDLTVRTAGRRWVNCDGRANFPDGEVFTGPIEDSAEGHIRYTYPAVYGGREVQDVRLRFAGGKVVEARAARGEEFLRTMIAIDEGASRIGEFAIGTNYGIQRFTRNTLFDEKIGGTIHLALGASLPESLGTNVSGLHWDMVCDLRDGGEIYADGTLIHQKGKFLI
jgi:aminopeptidase